MEIILDIEENLDNKMLLQCVYQDSSSRRIQYYSEVSTPGSPMRAYGFVNFQNVAFDYTSTSGYQVRSVYFLSDLLSRLKQVMFYIITSYSN